MVEYLASAARIRARFADAEFLRTVRHSKVVAPATHKIPAGAIGRGKKTIHTAATPKIQKVTSRARLAGKVARTKVPRLRHRPLIFAQL